LGKNEGLPRERKLVYINLMEIKKIAQLAYLLVDEENFEKDLSAILSYVDKLKELDTSQVEETAYLFLSQTL